MPTEANQRLIRRYLEEGVSTGRVDAAPRFISPAIVEVDNGIRHVAGLEGARAHIRGVRETYQDLHLTVERQIAVGERVVTQPTRVARIAGALARADTNRQAGRDHCRQRGPRRGRADRRKWRRGQSAGAAVRHRHNRHQRRRGDHACARRA